MNFNFSILARIIIVIIIIGFSSCNSGSNSIPEKEVKDSVVKENNKIDLKPVGAVPAWGPSIKPEMAVVIEKLVSLGGKPIETLSAQEARMQPTPTDAVMGVMKDNRVEIPPALCDTMGKDIPVTSGTVHARIYTPKTGKAPFPVIVYYHGGGWVIADNNVYSASAQSLCEMTNAIVVSIEYPKGPEHKFPAAHVASFDAYKWIISNATSMNGDSSKVAVVGESAGGNLAANISIMARDNKIKMPVYEVLIYPVANNDMMSESYIKYAEAKPLNKAMMVWFVKNELSTTAQSADPRISLVKANLSGMPPTLIIGAEIDPLQSEGKLLADKFKAANVDTDYELYNGVTHEFFGMAAIVPQAKEAQELAVKKLKKFFEKE
ncbi:alpha/beta hydrolase [Ferruginibacter albus]|uniref:alpha/beta hydrolase n=1 Tax=Ferruginibacter albus TaxID=2875540 RepID=UPI001CC4CA1B|nr:alpha/beta hydrolase [Ferruginibacter albus]UAY53090.1 alpha/beta hydrolase [Ferruginibacter albus]